MPSPPALDRRGALFFDFDGTLADIAAHPGDVCVHADLPPTLDALRQRLDGALAVVTGRPVREVDHFLAPLQLPAAGVHGAERRAPDGGWSRLPVPDLSAAAEALERWCGQHPGAWLERKPGALALHYRGHDALEAPARAAMARAHELLSERTAGDAGGTVVLHGKKVVELKPAAADKGHAVRAFMEVPPFAGRCPWFFGDDVTDEAGFAAVQAVGGVAVKVGPGDTVARHRLDDPAALRGWLAAQVRALGGRPAAGAASGAAAA